MNASAPRPYQTPRLAWLPIVSIGLLAVGMGLAFLLLRPSVILLPEDQRYTGLSPQQLLELDPQLFSWIGLVFRSWGAFGIGLGLMIAGVGAFGYRRGEAWAERLLFATGVCTFGIFLTVNVLLSSDFAFAIGGIFLVYLASLGFGVWARSRPLPTAQAQSRGSDRLRRASGRRVTPGRVLGQIHRQHFAVLSTGGPDGAPGSAGVSYGATRIGEDLAIYVMTRRHLLKARNIQSNSRVSLVIPVPRPVLTFLPPATIQLHGHAELLNWDDPDGAAVFDSFWMGRRIVRAYQRSRDAGETRVCFIKIVPDPSAHSYMVGFHIWELSRNMEAASGTVSLASSDDHRHAPV